MKLKALILLIFGVLLIAVATNHSTNLFKRSTIEVEKNHLLSVAYSSSAHIQLYFQDIEKAVKTLSGSSSTINALDGFKKTFNTLGDPNQKPQEYLHNRYIANNPFEKADRRHLIEIKNSLNPYDLSHKKFHPYFLKEQERHGFYDIFLIDELGNVIYSVDKEDDFGVNIFNSSINIDGLANIYKKASKSALGDIVFQDFKPYYPSNNRQAAFLATPIFENGILSGVFAIQIPVSKINSVMSFGDKRQEVGLGKSGEVYLVGDDLLMRSNSRFSDVSTIGKVAVNTSSVNNALNGNTGFDEVKDYRGVSVYSAYIPINVFEKTWALLAEINTEEILGEIHENTLLVFIESLGAAIAVLLLYAKLFNTSVISPLKSENDELKKEISAKNRQLSLSNSISEEYKHAFDLISVVSKTNADGIITYVNENFCDLTKYSSEELIGRSHNILSSPTTPKELHKDLWETISSKRIWNGEITNVNKDKEMYKVDLTIIPILDENGDIKEFMSIVYKL